MSALVAELRALALRDTPVVLPFPRGISCSSAEPTSSSHQNFAHVDELGYLLHVPDLVDRVVHHAFAYIDRRLAQLGRTTSSGLLPTTKAKVDAALRDFETADLLAYNESDIQFVTQQLLSSLRPVIADCDHHLAPVGADTTSPTRALACAQVAIPNRDPTGREVSIRVIPDITLYRLADEPNKAEPVVTIELKTPHASLGMHEPCTTRSGLFVRAVDAVAQAGGVRWTEIRGDPAVSSLLKKEIVTARTYGHDLVIFADGFSFFIGVVVQVEPHLYHVLISDLERLAPPAPSTSLYYAVHVAAFYTKLAEMAQHFRALAIDLAATAARAGPAADPAVDGRDRGGREQQGGHVQSGTSVDTIADSASRLSLDDSMLLIYPDGSTTPARTLRHWPSTFPTSSTPSAASPTAATASSSADTSTFSPLFSCDGEPASLSSPTTAASASLPMSILLGSSSRARVYSCTFRGAPHVVKISHGKGKGADELEHEALLLARSNVRALEDDVVRAVAAFESDDGRVVLVERDGGDALERWDELTEPQRISLVLSVLRLHQLAHLFHGDLAPRNVVVPPLSSSPSSSSTSTASPSPTPKPRLIDLGHAEEHEQPCTGRACAEVRQLVRELALEPLELDEVGRRAASEGLVW